MKRWLKVAVALLVVALVGYAGFASYVSWRSATSLLHPARPSFTLHPSDVGLSYSNVTLSTSDGVQLAGWWMPAAPNASKGAVVFLHGYGDSKNQSLEYAPFLHRAGFDVLAFDFRAHGESQGDHTTVGYDEVRDVDAAVAYAAQRDPGDVAIFGLSMGGAAGLNAAPDLPVVKAVVTDSAFATLNDIAGNSITHFTHLPKYPYGPLAVWFAELQVRESIAKNRPVDQAARLHVPYFIIQGGADDIARPAEAGEALQRADPSASYSVVPGASHVGAHGVARADYEARVTEFLVASAATTSAS